MRRPPRRRTLALLTGASAALAAPLAAQVGAYSSTHRPNQTRSLSGYPGRAKVDAARAKAREIDMASRVPVGTVAPTPPPPTIEAHTEMTAPNRALWRMAHGAEAFPDYATTVEKAREAGTLPKAPPGKAAPAPRPKAPRPRAAASYLRNLSDESRAELRYMRALQAETNVRRAVRETSEARGVVTEFELVREVLTRTGSRPPATREELAEAGYQVPRSDLRAGDLLFFELGDGPAASRHVGIFYGNGRFAYASRRGVRLGDLDEPRFRESLVQARRIP